jgi:tetratricopeptide (TPR) repeat protein
MKRFLICAVAFCITASAPAQDFLVRGKSALTAKDTALAWNMLQQALKGGEKPAETNLLLGSIAYGQKKYKEAIPYLQTAVKLNEDNVDAVTMLGTSQLETKDIAGALATLHRVEKIGKKNPAALTAYGRAFLMADSVEQAIRFLTLAKEYDRNSPAVSSMLGDAYLRQNVPPLALTHYQRAVELNPKDTESRMKMARIYEKMQNYNEAVKQYDGVLAIDSVRTDALFAKGKILVRAKMYERAVSPLRKFTSLEPKSPEGAALFARALHGSENYPEAAKEAKRALKLDSTNNDIWRVLAESQLELKDFPGAIVSYRTLLLRSALKPEDQAKYGNALVGGGKEEEALAALLQAVKLDSTNCDPYYNLGSIYMRKQEWLNAAANFEKKIACDPRSLGAYLNAAACYYQPTVKNYGRMRELLMKSLELKPDWLLARLWLGRYYTAVDSLAKAKEQYDEVIRTVGPNPDKRNKDIAGEAEYMVGQYYFALQQYDKCVDACKRAYTIGYDNFSLRITWGQSLLQTLNPKGDPADNKRKVEDATRQFRRAAELDPGSAAAHLWLAQSLVLSRVEGDNEGNKVLRDEACGEYRKALRIDPRNEDAKKGMERIGCPGAGGK